MENGLYPGSVFRTEAKKEKVGNAGFLLFFLIVVSPIHAQPMVVYFGNSITEGWINAELHQDQAFPSLTSDLLRTEFNDLLALNKGKGGNTTADAMKRVQPDVLINAPEVVVIEFGWNDCLVHDSHNGPAVPLAVFRFNIVNMVTILRDAGSHVVLVGMNPVDSARFYQYFSEENYRPYGGITGQRESYSTALRSVAEEMAVDFLTVDFSDPDTTLDMFAFDGLHPSAAGHRWIAGGLAPMIRTLLSSGTNTPPLLPLTIYPQPYFRGVGSHVSLRFSPSKASLFQVRILSETGACVYEYTGYAATTRNATYTWNGRDEYGREVARGVYVVIVNTGNRQYFKKLIVH